MADSVRSSSEASSGTTRTGCGSMPITWSDARLPDPAAIHRTSTREPSAIDSSRDSDVSDSASRSSSRSTGRAPRIDWVRSMRARAASALPINSVRVTSRIRAAIRSAVVSWHGTGIGAKPCGGRTQIDSNSKRFARWLGPMTRIEPDEPRSAFSISNRGRSTAARSGDSGFGFGWGIVPAHRKNDARPKLFCALVAVLGTGVACAQFQTAFQAGFESRQARLDAQRRNAPTYHGVRRGETLDEIANRYHTDVHELARANGLRDSDRVSVGRRIAIPPTRIVHRVQPGESLQEISDRYQVPVSTIAYLNHMGLSRRVQVGQRLVILRPATPDTVATSPRNAAASTRTAATPPRNVATPPRDDDVSAAPPERVAVAPERAVPAAPGIDTATQDRLARARSLVDRAVASYRAADFPAAIGSAHKADDELKDLGERPDARRLSARAAFVAGSAQAARGETDRATASFARVHALDPSFEPPNGWLSPRLEALFAEAKPD
jgi:LysM repeat protein